jgi:hypothetical protein
MFFRKIICSDTFTINKILNPAKSHFSFLSASQSFNEFTLLHQIFLLQKTIPLHPLPCEATISTN